MTLDDKRKVIEVLLCCGNPEEVDGIGEVMQDFYGLDDDALFLFEVASGARKDVARDRYGDESMSVSEDTYEDDCLEAAYRLIESSPTLRKEWFGCWRSPSSCSDS